MGILITSYKSLPEQVEANKEKCEDLQEQINNIDTSEIEAVKQQVEDNTHDITSLTNGLSVTNGLVANHTQRLNGLDTAVDNKVDKVTQYTNSKIEFTSATNALDIRRTEGDTDSLTETYSRHGTNVLTEGYEYSEDGVMLHQAKAIYDEDGINFYKTGTDFKVNNKVIVTEENIEEYAPQTHLYNHNLYFTGGGYWNFSIITNSATPLTASDVAKWLYDNGHTSNNLALNITTIHDRSNWYEIRIYSTDGLTPSGQSNRFILSASSNATISLSTTSIALSTFESLVDVVTQIS